MKPKHHHDKALEPKQDRANTKEGKEGYCILGMVVDWLLTLKCKLHITWNEGVHDSLL